MIGACFALWLAVPPFEWHWPLPGSLDLGAILGQLPGAVLVALLAPFVSYRRRDALTMLFFPPAGIRIAWIIGTRLGQLPERDWPTRKDTLPVQGRQAARIAIAVNRYRLWRQKSAERAATQRTEPNFPPPSRMRGSIRARCVPDGAVNRGRSRSLRGSLTPKPICKRADGPGMADDLVSSGSRVGTLAV